jgi:maleate isomerase
MSTAAQRVKSRRYAEPVAFDAGPGARARIGLVALSGDATVEPDFRRLGLGPDVEIYVSRVAFGKVTIEGLREVAEHLTAATALILPGQRLDVVAYGCTSGTIVVGEEGIGRRIAAARPACPGPRPSPGRWPGSASWA